MKGNIEQEILNYGSLLNSLTDSQVSILKEAILNMQTFGVTSYAERIIDSKGRSIKICNNYKWQELEKENSFFYDFSNHISLELLNNYKSNNKIITRSGDKVFNKFLARLEIEKLNSSIIVNEFYKGCIMVSYFMVESSCPINRDFILNNLSTIELIRKRIQALLLDLFLLNKLDQNKKLLLNKESVHGIFNSIKKDIVTLRLNQNIINLTRREVDCLENIRTGANNQFIAQNLQISVETVKFHLKNIKLKTGIISRSGLVELASMTPSSNHSINNII